MPERDKANIGSQEEKGAELNRRKVLSSIGLGTASVAGVSGFSGVGTAEKSTIADDIREVKGKELEKVRSKIIGSDDFSAVSSRLEEEYKVEVKTQVRLALHRDDSEPYYSVSFKVDDDDIEPKVEFVANIRQREVTNVKGAILSYSDSQKKQNYDQLQTVESYVSSEGNVERTVEDVNVPNKNASPGLSAQQCGCGDIPDVCPWCKSAVPVVCLLGCAAGVTQICDAISGPAPGTAVCAGLVSAICGEVSGSNRCSGSGPQFICEEAGLCQ